MAKNELPTVATEEQAREEAKEFGTAQERVLLDAYYEPPGGPPGKPYFNTVAWVNPTYAGTSLQKQRTDRSRDLFYKPGRSRFAFRAGFADRIAADPNILTGGERVSLVALGAWMYHDEEVAPGYENLAGDFVPRPLTANVLRTYSPLHPHVVLLEEWNVAQVEAYLAAVLQAIDRGVPIPLAREETAALPIDTLFLATCNSYRDEPANGIVWGPPGADGVPLRWLESWFDLARRDGARPETAPAVGDRERGSVRHSTLSNRFSLRVC